MVLKEIVNNLNGNTRRRAKQKAIVGTSIGVLVGAAVGILLAPKSGKEIRKDIKLGAERSAVKAREAALKAARFFKDEAEIVHEKVSEKKANDPKTHAKGATRETVMTPEEDSKPEK